MIVQHRPHKNPGVNSGKEVYTVPFGTNKPG